MFARNQRGGGVSLLSTKIAQSRSPLSSPEIGAGSLCLMFDARLPIPRTPHFGPIVIVLLPAPPECQPNVNFTHWKHLRVEFVNIRPCFYCQAASTPPVNLIRDNIIPDFPNDLKVSCFGRDLSTTPLFFSPRNR